MKGKTFLILLVAAGVLVALSFLRFGGEKHTGTVKMGARLFADLPVNAVAGITIADSENRVTLVKGEKVWEVEERNGYPADFDELRDTVVKLSRLKIGRSFTGSPDSMARLSLTPPSASDAGATGRQITLKDQAGKILADVILGQTRETDGGGSGGQYLKKADADTIFLVDGDFRFLKTAPAQWLKKEVLDIRSDDVASVVCYADESPTPAYTLSRPEKGESARMDPVPPGRNADTEKIGQVLDALAPLTLDDVKAGREKPLAAESDRPRLVYHLYDGRRILIFPESDGDDSYVLRITAEADPLDAGAAEAPETEADRQQEEEETPPPAHESARQLNEELSPWVFSVKKWQFDSFITQPESLLEALEKEGDGTS
jgi:Domain of unknown function (DUF4340)